MSMDSARTAALGTATLLMAGLSALLLFPPGIEHDLEPGLGGPGFERPGPGGPGVSPFKARATPSQDGVAATAPEDDGADDADALRDAPAEGPAQAAPRGEPLSSGAGPGSSRGLRISSSPGAARSAALERGAASTRSSNQEWRKAPSAPRPSSRLAAARRAAAPASSIQRHRHYSPGNAAARTDSAFKRTNAARRGRARAGDLGGGYGRSGHVRAGQARAATLFDPSSSGDRGRTDSRERRRRRRDLAPRRLSRRGRLARTGRARANARRFTPFLLGSAPGPKALRPPDMKLEPPPALLLLPDRRPKNDFSGRPTPDAFADLSAAEALDPTELSRDRHAGPHWDNDQWHDGPARGLDQGGSWLWTYRDGARLWALAGQPAAPLLRRGGVWWMKQDGMWFVVHDGEPWAFRHFEDWDAQGLFEPKTGTQIVYSSDYSRAVVITPGSGAEVFDARTGALIGSIAEDRMPAPRRPKVPQSLPTPQ